MDTAMLIPAGRRALRTVVLRGEADRMLVSAAARLHPVSAGTSACRFSPTFTRICSGHGT
jgi:hypothetical protein